MGKLVNKVQTAFDYFKAGNLEAFIKTVVDAGDVNYQHHRDIVDNEVEKQLEKMGATKIKYKKYGRYELIGIDFVKGRAFFSVGSNFNIGVRTVRKEGDKQFVVLNGKKIYLR